MATPQARGKPAPFARKARCFEPKKFQIPPRPADPIRAVPIPGRQKQKSPTDPRGSFGLT